jgi:hypothetical protein
LNKNIKKIDPESTIHATVKDYSALDGCGKILITDAGFKILPSNEEVLEAFIKDDHVVIKYDRKPDMMSACMAEDFIAHISFIEAYHGKPSLENCIEAFDLNDLNWLVNVRTDADLVHVRKYLVAEGKWRYLFLYRSGEAKLYNCHGQLRTTFEDTKSKKAQNSLNNMELISLIYESKTASK